MVTALPTIPWHAIAVILYYLCISGYAIFTGILYYHWQNYSMDNRASLHTYVAYFLISIPLIITMSISVYLI